MYQIFYKATSKGPVEMVQLLADMKSIVQIIEEFIFMGIILNLMSFVSIFLSLFGLVLIIFPKEDNKRYSDQVSNDDSQEKNTIVSFVKS